MRNQVEKTRFSKSPQLTIISPWEKMLTALLRSSLKSGIISNSKSNKFSFCRLKVFHHHHHLDEDRWLVQITNDWNKRRIENIINFCPLSKPTFDFVNLDKNSLLIRSIKDFLIFRWSNGTKIRSSLGIFLNNDYLLMSFTVRSSFVLVASETMIESNVLLIDAVNEYKFRSLFFSVAK